MELIEAATGRQLDLFIEQPSVVYRNDPLYAPPLKREMRREFSHSNPFFDHAEVKFFLVRKGGKPAGRVASIINRRHIEYQGERAGFFGFFECVDDPEAASLLMDRVKEELKGHGMEVMRGPMNFSTNEECGFLIEGFEEPPMLMTPYNPPYYDGLMQGCGLNKAKDLFAYIHEVKEELPEKVLKVASIAERRGVTVRPINMKDFLSDMMAFREIYNSAWADNWGFIPLTEREVEFLARRLKEAVVPELTLVAEVGGEPAGFMGLLPDFNHVLRKMNGKLNPLSIVKALYYSRKIKDLRLLLLGIKKEYRLKGLDALLFREGFKGVRKGGYRRVEFSWVLEDNLPVQRLVEMIEGRLYKRYRIYEKRLV
jgi:hypothetical protein